MKRLLDFKALYADYASYHTHPKNRFLHCFGIPIIVLCVVRWTQLGDSRVPWALAVLPLYLAWDARLGVLMGLAVAGMAALAPAIPSWGVWALFVFGWILQFLGHWAFEGKSPAFQKNLLHLLVGPMFIMHELTGAGRVR